MNSPIVLSLTQWEERQNCYKKVQTPVAIKPEDLAVLLEATRACNIPLKDYISEVIECKVAELREAKTLSEEAEVTLALLAIS